jgi:hypothetical protein
MCRAAAGGCRTDAVHDCLRRQRDCRRSHPALFGTAEYSARRKSIALWLRRHQQKRCQDQRREGGDGEVDANAGQATGRTQFELVPETWTG